ncbi:MAG: ECF transporter S component [Actinobacteria bacterium]|nr:ECF transporter S component [Actinomycetota bacterium]
MRRRSALLLAVGCLAGLALFSWPLLITPGDGVGRATDAPWLFAAILPLVLAIVLCELADGGMDTKALALLAVLSAIGAVLRPLGAGTAGVELVFFLLVPAGRVLGPGFGFTLGCTTLLTSALLTGGVGPWLPFQMLGAAWIGMGAGLLPRRRLRGRGEIALLAVFGAVSAYLYGLLLNLAFWPFTLGSDTALSYVAGSPVADNLHRFLLYTLATSTFGWDTGRALTTAAAIVLAGPAVLASLRRAHRRASFAPPAAPAPDPSGVPLPVQWRGPAGGRPVDHLPQR